MYTYIYTYILYVWNRYGNYIKQIDIDMYIYINVPNIYGKYIYIWNINGTLHIHESYVEII